MQTFTPEHYVLNYAVRQDYEGFYKEEIALRKALIYPPFCDILSVNFSSVMELRCKDAAKCFVEFMNRFHKELAPEIPLVILGPAAGYPEKINGRYRYRLIIKCRNGSKLRKVINASLKAAESDGSFAKVIFYADLNGELL